MGPEILSSQHSLKYRRDIDGLRAIAVLSVLAYHAFPNLLPGGFAGVDIFFVISGFLISTIIFESLEAGTFSFSAFYARRIKRIFPALVLVLAASYAFGWFALLADEYQQLGRHIAGGAGFASNLVLWSESGYFDNAADKKPLLHLWSLGIEEQFYIVWPLLLWLAWKQRVKVLIVTVLLVAISFYINLKGVKADAVATFYSPQTRFWELLTGGVLAWFSALRPGALAQVRARMDRWLATVRHKEPPRGDGRTLDNVLGFFGLFLLLYGFVRLNKDLDFPGKWAIVPVLGAVSVILAGPAAWPNRKLLSNKVAVWFGLISFPLYLWHWPLLSFTRIVESGTPSPWARGLLVLVAVVLAWVTYELLERRVRAPGRTPSKVGSLLVIMVALGGIGWATYANEGLKFRGHIQETNAANAQLVGWNWRYIKNDRCLNKYPLQGTDAYGVWFCMVSSDKNPTLLLLGDSHANHLYAGFVNNPEFRQQSVLSIGNCDPGWVEKSELSPVVTSYTCSGYRILDQMALINQIVSTSHSVRYAIMAGAGLNQKTSPGYVAKLRRRINFLESQGVKVILFAPHVWLSYNPRACFGRPFAKPKESCELPALNYRKKLSDFNQIAQAITATNPSVRVFDQNVLFCNEAKCSFKKDGMPLLRDEFGHLSEYGSDQLVTLFAKWARTNAPDLLANKPIVR